MSEANPSPGGTPPSSGGTNELENQNPKPNETVSYESYQKAVDEAKKAKARSAQLEQEAESRKQEELKAQGKFKEIAESQATQIATLEKKLKEDNAKYAAKVVTSQIRAEAAKLGCVDPDALLKLMDMSEIEVDGEFNIDPSKLKTVLEKEAKEKAYLFSKDAPTFRDAPPSSGKPAGKLAYEEWVKLPLDEKKKRYSEVFPAEKR